MMKKIMLLLAILVSNLGFSQIHNTTDIVSPPPPPTREPIPIEGEIVEFPKVENQFKGGREAMQKYISANVNYPTEAIENNIQGRVYLSFVVEKDGSISSIAIMRGVHSTLDKEAIQLIKNMPNWIPGKNVKGDKIRSRVRLPINFTLDNGNKDEKKKDKRKKNK